MCTYLCQIAFFPNLPLPMANFHKILGLVAVANTVFVAAFLYQLCDSIQLDFESVPDDKNWDMDINNDMYLVSQEM